MVVSTKKLEPSNDPVGAARRKSLGRLRNRIADAWRPKAKVKVSDFATKNFRLSRTWEGAPGFYNLTENPFWREILDCFEDTSVYKITVKKSTQVGGTLTLMAAILALSKLDPSPAMLVAPDLVNTIELRERLYENALESKEFREQVPPKRHWNNRHLDLQTMRCYLAWAGSKQRLRGRACKRVFRSEIDVYPPPDPISGDPLRASAERVKRFYWSQIYDESSPAGDQSAIAQFYDESDQRSWWCKCPQCGRHQVLRFFPFKDGDRAGRGGVVGYQNDDGSLVEPDAARRQAYYVCVDGCKLSNDEVNQAIIAGAPENGGHGWLPAGQTVNSDGEVIGTPDRDGRHRGYHLWSIHSPTLSIGNIAAEYIAHRNNNKLREFFENWLGLRYRATQRVPHWEKLGKHIRDSYLPKTVPNDCWFLTAGLDVQLNGIYFVIRGWGHQATSWLIDFGFIQRYQESEDPDGEMLASDLTRIEEAVMQRKFRVVDGTNPLGKRSLKVLFGLIDANYRTRDVHNFVHQRPDDRLFCCRGDPKVSYHERFRYSVVERPARGGDKYAGGGMRQWQICTGAYKEDIVTRFLIPGGRSGAFNVPANILTIGAQYLQQITNEYPDEEINKAGRRQTVWKVRNPALGNHMGDCEVYDSAAAEIVLAKSQMTWDARTWNTAIEQPVDTPSVVARDHMGI